MGEYTGRLNYGGKTLEGFLPKAIEDESRMIPITLPKGLPEIINVERALNEAIEKSSTPDKVPALATILKEHYKGGLVSILVDDHTRPNIHTRLLLPPLLRKLRSLGVKRDNFRFIVSHGTHRKAKEEELHKILGDEIYGEHKGFVECHDSVEGVKSIGKLEEGIPIEFNKTAFNSDIVIGLSDLDYHYFAGLGGGPKQIVPGITGKNTIISEHLKMFGKIGFAENVDMGILKNNPVYECKIRIVEKIDEVMRKKGSWIYALITVIDEQGKLVYLVGGDTIKLHKQGEAVLRKVNVASFPRQADVVIMSARHLGIDMYQTGKVFNSARRAVKAGGKIVVLSPCSDGWGSEEFKGLMSLATPILQDTEKKLKKLKGKEWGKEAEKGIVKALMTVQEVVMKDFKIGKQKPVDLLVTLRHCGWGNLFMLQEGLRKEDKVILPIEFIGKNDEDPTTRLRNWIERLEKDTNGKLLYCLVNDPTILLCLEV